MEDLGLVIAQRVRYRGADGATSAALDIGGSHMSMRLEIVRAIAENPDPQGATSGVEGLTEPFDRVRTVLVARPREETPRRPGDVVRIGGGAEQLVRRVRAALRQAGQGERAAVAGSYEDVQGLAQEDPEGVP